MAKKKDKIELHVEDMCKQISSFLGTNYPETVTVKRGRKKSTDFQPYLQMLKSFYIWQDLERQKILNGIWKIPMDEEK